MRLFNIKTVITTKAWIAIEAESLEEAIERVESGNPGLNKTELSVKRQAIKEESNELYDTRLKYQSSKSTK